MESGGGITRDGGVGGEGCKAGEGERIKNIQVEARETTLFGATKNSAANGSMG